MFLVGRGIHTILMVQKSQTTNHLKCKKKTTVKTAIFFPSQLVQDLVHWCRIWSIISTIHPFLFVDFPPNSIRIPTGSVRWGRGCLGYDHWAQITIKKTRGLDVQGLYWGNPKQKRTTSGPWLLGSRTSQEAVGQLSRYSTERCLWQLCAAQSLAATTMMVSLTATFIL